MKRYIAKLRVILDRDGEREYHTYTSDVTEWRQLLLEGGLSSWAAQEVLLDDFRERLDANPYIPHIEDVVDACIEAHYQETA